MDSVKATIHSIDENLASAYSKVEGKGGVVSGSKNFQNLAKSILSIGG